MQPKLLFILKDLINSGRLNARETHAIWKWSALCLKKTTFLFNFNNVGEKLRDIVIRLCAEKQIKSWLNHNLNNTLTKNVKSEAEMVLKTKEAIYLIY